MNSCENSLLNTQTITSLSLFLRFRNKNRISRVVFAKAVWYKGISYEATKLHDRLRRRRMGRRRPGQCARELVLPPELLLYANRVAGGPHHALPERRLPARGETRGFG